MMWMRRILMVAALCGAMLVGQAQAAEFELMALGWEAAPTNGATATDYNGTNHKYRGWDFPDTADKCIHYHILLPSDYVTGDLAGLAKIMSPAATPSGQVTFYFKIACGAIPHTASFSAAGNGMSATPTTQYQEELVGAYLSADIVDTDAYCNIYRTAVLALCRNVTDASTQTVSVLAASIKY